MEKEERKIKFLSELQEGETAFIAKVRGYGAFRKRITEMGFICGAKITSIRKAPLQDPVEYELLGSRISLRESEASFIEIVSEKDLQAIDQFKYEGTLSPEVISHYLGEKSKTIQVALVGNPNCGKTSLFNQATGRQEKVGNYSGVTVNLKTAHFNIDGYRINLTDLPGTYSISELSIEEAYVRKHLTDSMPDVVINVIDATNLERNLFLTTQLIDMNVKVVIALNMYDELTKSGDHFDYVLLGKMIGIPIIPTIAAKGKGVSDLMRKVIESYEEQDEYFRHIHISYGADLNQSIDLLAKEIKRNETLYNRFHSRFTAIKFLENEENFREEVLKVKGTEDILELAADEIQRLQKKHNTSPGNLITDAKYAFITGALKETYTASSKSMLFKRYRADRLLTNKRWGIPIFLLLMWVMFQTTFSLGEYPRMLIEKMMNLLQNGIIHLIPEGMLLDFITQGLIEGLGGVLVFLPNILILFFFISLMEDTGYLARTAFIMDKLMHKVHLHGKSFIPLLIGFGCNVPAIMATRTLENKKDRILTILLIPFMSCSARLPVYVLLISAFFPRMQGLVLFSVYFIGILLGGLMALLYKKAFFNKEEVPFVMELPPYRLPNVKNTLSQMWTKSVQYLSKMGSVILVASILLWAAMYFPVNVNYSKDYEKSKQEVRSSLACSDSIKLLNIEAIKAEQRAEKLEKSYIGQLGKVLSPVLSPLGYDWKIGVSIISGFAAKEIIVSSMGILYQTESKKGSSFENLQKRLQEETYSSGSKKGKLVFTPLIAFSLMVFILIYFPCIAVLGAIRKEVGLKWTLFSAFYNTFLAWLLAFIIYQVGSHFI